MSEMETSHYCYHINREYCISLGDFGRTIVYSVLSNMSQNHVVHSLCSTVFVVYVGSSSPLKFETESPARMILRLVSFPIQFIVYLPVRRYA